MREIATNKRAFYEYEILDKIEAGISLLGSEVKSARAGQVSLADSYAAVQGGELYLLNCYFAPYKQAGERGIDPRRSRKLLLHKSEIKKLIQKVKEKGLTLIPTKMYFKNNRLKVELGLAKGKRKFEKREAIKRREAEREIRREKLKNHPYNFG